MKTTLRVTFYKFWRLKKKSAQSLFRLLPKFWLGLLTNNFTKIIFGISLISVWIWRGFQIGQKFYRKKSNFGLGSLERQNKYWNHSSKFAGFLEKSFKIWFSQFEISHYVGCASKLWTILEDYNYVSFRISF